LTPESTVAQVVSSWPASAAKHCWPPTGRVAQHAWAAAQLLAVEVAVEVDVLVGVVVDVTVEVAVEVVVEVAVAVVVGQSPCAWRADSTVAQVVSFWPASEAVHCCAPAPRDAQHAWAAAQLLAVEVTVEVDVPVGVVVDVVVEVAVEVPPEHAGFTQVPAGAVLACTQSLRAKRAVRQGDPTVRFCMAQFASHMDAVLSQGHCISQAMKAAHALPVRSPLAKLLPKPAWYSAAQAAKTQLLYASSPVQVCPPLLPGHCPPVLGLRPELGASLVRRASSAGGGVVVPESSLAPEGGTLASSAGGGMAAAASGSTFEGGTLASSAGGGVVAAASSFALGVVSLELPQPTIVARIPTVKIPMNVRMSSPSRSDVCIPVSGKLREYGTELGHAKLGPREDQGPPAPPSRPRTMGRRVATRLRPAI
jgi:hypothetical protein